MEVELSNKKLNSYRKIEKILFIKIKFYFWIVSANKILNKINKIESYYLCNLTKHEISDIIQKETNPTAMVSVSFGKNKAH